MGSYQQGAWFVIIIWRYMDQTSVKFNTVKYRKSSGVDLTRKATTITLHRWFLLLTGQPKLNLYLHIILACDLLAAEQFTALPDVDCGPLDNPEDGAVSLTGTTYISVATYSCDSGYVLMGDEMRTCLDTGLWSGSTPTCSKLLKCKKYLVGHIFTWCLVPDTSHPS